MTKPIDLTNQHRQSIEDFRSQHKTGLLALLFTDIVGSTAIKQDLGDEAGNALIIKHNEIVRDLLKEFPEGAEISTAGDSFFIAFVRPSDAVRFSLLLHSRLRLLSTETPKPIAIRIGIHMGEVHIIEESDSIGMRDILGLQVDIAARIMSLGQGGQTLMSRGVFDNARSIIKCDDISLLHTLSWMNHGPYTLKGVEEPQDIAEVGEKGIAPLLAPPDSEKAKSIAPIDGNLVVGWRPSPGAEIPTSLGWILLEKLGEGGFGEVWKAQKTKVSDENSLATEMDALQSLPIGETVAFKFCFDIAHARALKREATLFKLLQKKQGELKHTVKMLDYHITEAPLFLAMEFIEGKNLAQWLKEDGAAIKPVKRLQMMAPVAQSIHDIHEAGIIINDIKPSNIMVRVTEGGKPEFLLTDLGVGQIRDKRFLEQADQTRTTGFTKTSLTLASGSSGAQGGSLLYLAPEILEGEKPSVASDAYALGVTLMQIAAGNPCKAVADDWKLERSRIGIDPSLKEFFKNYIGPFIFSNPEQRANELTRFSRTLRWFPQLRVFALFTWVFSFVCLSVFSINLHELNEMRYWLFPFSFFTVFSGVIAFTYICSWLGALVLQQGVKYIGKYKLDIKLAVTYCYHANYLPVIVSLGVHALCRSTGVSDVSIYWILIFVVPFALISQFSAFYLNILKPEHTCLSVKETMLLLLFYNLAILFLAVCVVIECYVVSSMIT